MRPHVPLFNSVAGRMVAQLEVLKVAQLEVLKVAQLEVRQGLLGAGQLVVLGSLFEP